MIICSIYPQAIRLDRFLRSVFGPIPQSTLEKMCRRKSLKVNGKIAEPKTRVMARDEIDVQFDGTFVDNFKGSPAPYSPNNNKTISSTEKEFKDLIIYDKPDFCIIHKPYGLPSQGGPGITGSVDKLAGSNYWIVHRLDRHTEGLMILAKNRHTATHLTELFKNREVQKYYYAIVKGRPKKDAGIIDLPLKNICEEGDDKMIVDPKGQKAITRYRIVKVLNSHHTLVLLKPLTGRKHQLRVHMAALGTPIFGDMKYGKRAKRMHLYAFKLSFDGFQFTLPQPYPPHTLHYEKE